MKQRAVKLSVFLFQADILAKSIGLIPYDDHSKSQRLRKLKNVIFVIFLINLNVVYLEEFVFVVQSMMRGENFKEATMCLSYLGFMFVSFIKMFSVLQKKSLLSVLMRDVHQLYPKDTKLQKAYNTRYYALKYNGISFGFVFIHQILIWSYNLYPAVCYLIYEYWLAIRVVPITLPYYAWLPWQWQGHWSYYFLYLSQNLAGHTCMSAQLANDLILCAVAIQIIMHYDHLAQTITTYQPSGSYEIDKEFLKQCIEYHQKILNLSIYMNEVFGVSLLVNFLSSSFTMCFLGFQMTVGVETDVLVMLFLFLFCSLLQILMICYYGEELIEKSESVGHAAYNHNWQKADVRFRKMLILIIKRAQKPALLKATSFVNVSLGTMTELTQLSYKFFALLRTMYGN